MKTSPVLEIVIRSLLLLSSCFTLLQSYHFFADYLQYRSEMDVRVKQENAPFPAVTLCIESGEYSQFTDRGTKDVEQLTVQLGDFVVSGTFNREFLSFPENNDDFREFLDVDYFGFCFTYNWDTSREHRTAKPGPIHGLRLLLNTSVSGTSNSRRVRIVVHEQGVAPIPHQSGITASSGLAIAVGFKQKTIHRLTDPYGECQERYQGFRFKYSQERCRTDCIRNLIFIACGCAFPHNPLIKYNPLQCNRTEQRKCLDRETRSRENDHSNCNCAPDCEETAYDTTSSTLLLPSTVSACFPSKTLDKDCTDYNSINLAVVEVYPTQSHYELLVETAVYTLPHFLSDVARNGFLLMLIVIMAVKLPTQVKEKNGQIIYEKAPLNTSYTDQT